MNNHHRDEPLFAAGFDRKNLGRPLRWVWGFFLICCFWGQEATGQDRTMPKADTNKSQDWFHKLLKSYLPQRVLAYPSAASASGISQKIRDGKLQLSLSQLKLATKENNLDITYASFGTEFAATDVLRAQGGGAPRGAPGVQIPSSLFAGAIGAGVGDTGGLGGSSSAGGISGGARAVTLRPRGSFDPALIMNFSMDRTTSPLNTIRVSGLPIVTTATTALQTRYSQAFTTGTSVSISFNNQRQSSTQQFLRFNPAFVSSFSFNFTQQLLNGFGKVVNRRFLDVAKNGQGIAREAFRQQTISTLAGAMTLYWDLAAARGNVAVAEKSLAVARQLYENNKMRSEIGVLSILEVTTAEAEMAARQRNLIIAQADRQMKEADLKHVLSAEVDGALEAAVLETADPLPEPKDEDIPRLSEAMALATKNRPELLQAEGNMLIQDAAVKYAKNLLKPTLTLFGLYSGAGLYGDRVIQDPNGGSPIILPGGISQAIRQVRNFNYPEYAFGFSFSIPLRNQSAQADNLRARLERKQSETTLEQTRGDISLEVRNAVIGLAQAKAQVEAAHQAAQLSRTTLSAEETKLAEGVSTPYDVIRRQRDLMAAQFAEVQAMAAYAKALVEIKRSTGVLDKD